MARDPLQPERPTRCPRCGGKLVFEREVNGYGRTIERCEHFQLHARIPGVVTGCSHWEVFPKTTHPAHVRPPRRPAPPLRTSASTGMRAGTRVKVNRVHAHLSRAGRPLTKAEVAAALRIPKSAAAFYLNLLVEHGRAAARPRREGKTGKPPKEYVPLDSVRAA